VVATPSFVNKILWEELVACSSDASLFIFFFFLLQLALQPLVGFGLLYDFVPQSSIFTLLSPVSHFLFYLFKPSQSWSSYWS
jgi:hypothetical protein